MRRLFYLMMFQILIGIWLMISPFVLGYREITGITTNNLVFGALVLLLGIGVVSYQKIFPGIEHTAKKAA